MEITSKKQFNWNNFSPGFLEAVAKACIVPPTEPNPDFVRKHRKIIEDHFLSENKQSAKTISLELASLGFGKSGTTIADYPSEIGYLRSLRISKALVKLYLKTLRQHGRGETIMDERNSFSIDLDLANMPDEQPFTFQREAIDKLEAYFNSEFQKETLEKLGWKPALLVMPTGSGKTMTSMWFVLEEMIRNGYKVLWLTHRELLLEQASETSKWLAKIALSSKKKHLKGRIISGVHSPASTATFQSEDFIFYSIQSLGRNFDRLDFLLNGVDGNKLIVVIDEAHHTPMHTYRKALELLKQKKPGFKLLGLTATPYRMVYTERNMLNYIYNSKYISCISMSDLIKKGFLATPHPERVDTDMDIEAELSEDDKKYIERFGDINDETAQKIAQSKKRNQCIIKQLSENRQKYGKTLIFAVNQIHAKTLADDLNSKGIKADYVINGQSGYNHDVIKKFKENELEVLVNVQILTEGSDIPDIKTVFLTRPTKSESLLLQMIGRALRGPKMHGTDIAYVVDFHDKWSTFQKWLNPEFILTSEERIEDPTKGSKDREVIEVPWDKIDQIYDNLHSPDFVLSTHSALPHGWYSLGYEDDQGRIESILVYDNARPAFERLENDIEWLVKNKASVKMVFDKYFGDIEDPLPNLRELEVLLNMAINDGKFPAYFKFDERSTADPKSFAVKIYDGDIKPKDQKQQLLNDYNDSSLIQQIFSDFNDFFNAVMKEYNNLLNPDENVVDRIKEREPILKKLPKLSAGPKYDLNNLYEKVAKEMFKGQLNRPATVSWSSRAFKGFWGYFRKSDRKLIINCQLDSPDVPQNVVEFVLYHELLHADGLSAHNKDFKKEERKFDKWEDCEHFLDTIHENFALS